MAFKTRKNQYDDIYGAAQSLAQSTANRGAAGAGNAQGRSAAGSYGSIGSAAGAISGIGSGIASGMGSYTAPKTETDSKTDYKSIIDDLMYSGAYGDTVGGYFNARNEKLQNPEYSQWRDPLWDAKVQDYIQRNTYKSKYGDRIESVLSQLENMGPFSYDAMSDPNYQAFAKSYGIMGDRAMADTLGEVAAMTGGMPSSYAVTAASQAKQQWDQRLTDMIPELYNAAYARYMNDYQMMADELGRLQSLENENRAQWESDRAYGNQILQQNTANDQWNQSFGAQNNQWQQSFDFEKSQAEKNDALTRAETLASYGDFSGYKALGYSDEQIKNMKNTYDAAQRLAQISSYQGRSGGSSSGGSSSSAKKTYYTSEEEKMAVNSIKNGNIEGNVMDILRSMYPNSTDEQIFENYGFKGTETGKALNFLTKMRKYIYDDGAVSGGAMSGSGMKQYNNEKITDEVERANNSGELSDGEAYYVLYRLGLL